MIDLSALPTASLAFELMEFGGILTPPLGGPSQKITRLGTRHRFAIETAPVSPASLWPATIAAAKEAGAVIRISQPGQRPWVGPEPTVAQVTIGGTSLPLAGLQPNMAIGPRWLSIVHAGRRYAHQVLVGAIAAADGTATVTITPMLRVPLAAGDKVEFIRPKAEGWLTGSLGWSVPRSRVTGFSLVLEEAE